MTWDTRTRLLLALSWHLCAEKPRPFWISFQALYVLAHLYIQQILN